MGCAFSKRNNPANAHSPLQVLSALPASTTGGTTATHGGFPEDGSLTRGRDILDKRRLGEVKRRSITYHGHSLDVPTRRGDDGDDYQRNVQATVGQTGRPLDRRATLPPLDSDAYQRNVQAAVGHGLKTGRPLVRRATLPPLGELDSDAYQRNVQAADGHGLKTGRPLVRRATLPPLGELDRGRTNSTSYGSDDHCQIAPALVVSKDSGVVSKDSGFVSKDSGVVSRESTSTMPVGRIRPTHSKRGRGHDSKGQVAPSSAQKKTVNKKPIVCDELLSISDDDLSWESAAAVCGSDVSSLDISDSECSSMNGDSTNKVDNSTQDVSSKTDNGRVEKQSGGKFRDKVRRLLTRLGKKLKQSDVPNGTTDARKCSPAVPEAFGNDQNKDQKQMELGNRCEKSNAGNSVPLTSQSSVPVKIIHLTHSKSGRGHNSKDEVAPSFTQNWTTNKERPTAYDELLPISYDGLIYEPATAVCSGDVGPVDFNGSERFRLNGEMTDKVDNSTQEVPCEVPCKANDGYLQRHGNTTERVQTLLTKCGTRQEQSDNPNGATDGRSGLLVVGNDQKENQKLTELGIRSGVDDADSSAPLTSQQFRDKVRRLLARLGKKFKHSDVPNGTTDERKCSPAVPEAFGNDQNKDQKQMELGNRCEVPVKIIHLTHSKGGRGHNSKDQFKPSFCANGTTNKERSTVYDELLSISDDDLICESATTVCRSDVGLVDIGGSECFRLNGQITDKVDSSTQEVPCRADDGYMQWSGNTTDRVRTLLTRCGKRQEQSDNANEGATDGRNGILVVGNDQKDNQKQTELGIRSGVDDADSVAPLTSQQCLLPSWPKGSPPLCVAVRPVGRRGARERLVLEPGKEKGLGRESTLITHALSSSRSTLHRLPTSEGISGSNNGLKNSMRRFEREIRNCGSCEHEEKRKRIAANLRLFGAVPENRCPAPVDVECERPSNPARRHRIPTYVSVVPAPLKKHHRVAPGVECERPTNPVRKHTIAPQPPVRSVHGFVKYQTWMTEQQNKGSGKCVVEKPESQLPDKINDEKAEEIHKLDLIGEGYMLH